MSELQPKTFTYVGGINQEHLPPPGTTRLVIGPSTTSLCYHLCNLCRNTLLEVIFPSNGSLKQIDVSAFSHCHKLLTVDIPGTVKMIGEDAFTHCVSLKHVNLREGLKQIEKKAFYCCSNLQTLAFPSTVDMIGTRAFYECIMLTTVTFAPKMKQTDDVYICTEAFARCKDLTRMKLPYTKYLKEGIFSECENLTHVDLPEGMKRIEEGAFHQCSSLLSIAVPSTVKYMEPYSFRYCVSLVSVELYPGYQTLNISDDVFLDCKSLCNISTSALSRDSYIHQRAFDGCDLLGGHEVPLHRYDELPIHSQCYEAALFKAKHLRENINWLRTKSTLKEHVTDKFGMTPFHVLLSAAKPRPDLLEVLLEGYSPHFLGWKDVLGNRPIDYLIRNYWSEDAKRSMKIALEKWMVEWVSSWGLDAWGTNMKPQVYDVLDSDIAEHRRLDRFNLAHDSLSKYERMESSTLLELWLWKMEMQKQQPSTGRLDRLNARNRCGAPFAVPNVMEFVGRTTASQPSPCARF